MDVDDAQVVSQSVSDMHTVHVQLLPRGVILPSQCMSYMQFEHPTTALFFASARSI